jgi:hypothetical protein
MRYCIIISINTCKKKKIIIIYSLFLDNIYVYHILYYIRTIINANFHTAQYFKSYF